MTKRIDLRSDTVTQPTQAMREAMAHAEVGDDVYGEDPTVRRLEERTAEVLGKEAALFVTSGTQGNQVAIAAHVHGGDEVIAEAESHIFYYEAAAVAAIAGAQIRQVPGVRGVLSGADVRAAIREEPNPHHPHTALISLENTHNRAGGTVWPLHALAEVQAVGRAAGVPVHMDGARLFNAAVALGVAPRDIAQYVDTVQVCLSKGLCAPVGSVLAGSRAFIERARVWRKRLGGGMRQAGVIAAPGLVALETMVDRLAEDHANARWFAEAVAELPGMDVDLETVQTNIVIVDVAGTGLTANAFVNRLGEAGVLCSAFGPTRVRFVTHHDVDRADVEAAFAAVAGLLQGAHA
ncbi:MAG: low-specificity L-threonine aldolase [Alicyclobacillus sp.]|nr:low-specificity L-threonine aldolase [Alicyclobacillus sp.]